MELLRETMYLIFNGGLSLLKNLSEYLMAIVPVVQGMAPLCAAIAAIVGLYFLLRSARATERAVIETKFAAQGELFFRLIRDYTSREMLEDMIRLGKLRDKKRMHDSKGSINGWANS
jgi:hypothetical protein